MALPVALTPQNESKQVAELMQLRFYSRLLMTKVINGDKRHLGLAAKAVDFAPLGRKAD